MSTITVTVDGNLYQVTPNNRINLHKYRSSISLDQNGISSIVKVLEPDAQVTLSDISNFLHIYTSDPLFATFTSINPDTVVQEQHSASIFSVFMSTSPFVSIVLTNRNAFQVSIRIFYS